VLSVRQRARKGKLAPKADRLYTAADILIVPNSTAPQSRVCRFMHDRGGNHFRRRCFSQNEAFVELAGAERVRIFSESSWNQPYPHTLKITDQSVVTSLIVPLDEPERFFHAKHDLLGVSLEIGPHPQPVDAFAGRKPQHHPVIESRPQV
jgi:hypothetical protein